MNIETLMQYNTEVTAWGMTFTLFELLFAFSYGAIGGVTSWLLHRNRGEVRIGEPIPTSEPWRLRYKVTRHVPFHVHLLTCATWPAVLAFCLLVWTLAAIDLCWRAVKWPFAVFRDGLRFRRQAAGGSREEKPGVIQDMLAYLYDCPGEWDDDEHRLGPNVAAEDIRRGQLLFVTKDGVRGVPAGNFVCHHKNAEWTGDITVSWGDPEPDKPNGVQIWLDGVQIWLDGKLMFQGGNPLTIVEHGNGTVDICCDRHPKRTDHRPPATSHQPLARRATVAEDEVMEAPAPVREGAAPYGSKLPEPAAPFDVREYDHVPHDADFHETHVQMRFERDDFARRDVYTVTRETVYTVSDWTKSRRLKS